ncbi:predicted protein [Sclerotinia sclerotiorum 1980 UF-70]|uniref:Uncharacterized protein n=1 Tax=Sclerotinia sclerotiorum (strain ATCC 18683 / 1980 / Ss-1) TaxID=665079 RepID=A7EF69_SCLS1|nr:predicted protein [Sclerotinia sclerotiorum 1980 UF-70]EDO01485.1 predicted protein [Sclerotinia sclerotiorum 1980 UF-70]
MSSTIRLKSHGKFALKLESTNIELHDEDATILELYEENNKPMETYKKTLPISAQADFTTAREIAEGEAESIFLTSITT